MSRNQWLIVAVLGLAVAMVLGCLGAFALLTLTDGFPTETSGPAQPIDTPTPRPTNTSTPPRVSAVCQSHTKDYLAQIEPLLAEWQDAVELADSTARIALSPMVRDMQRIRREIEDIPPPDCAQHGRSLLISGMDSIIDAFIDFMGDAPDATVSRKLERGFEQMTKGLEELSSLAMGRIPTTNTPVPSPVPPTPTRTRSSSAAAPTNTRVIPVTTPVPASPTPVAPTPTSTPIPLGGTMIVDNWEIRVERVETAAQITSPYSDDTYKAAGRFALVFMAVTNRDLRPNTFVAFGTVDVQDAEGRRYQEDPVVGAIAMFIYDTDIPASINPDATVHCVAAFDISRQSSWYQLVPGSLAGPSTGSIGLSIP